MSMRARSSSTTRDQTNQSARPSSCCGRPAIGKHSSDSLTQRASRFHSQLPSLAMRCALVSFARLSASSSRMREARIM